MTEMPMDVSRSLFCTTANFLCEREQNVELFRRVKRETTATTVSKNAKENSFSIEKVFKAICFHA